MRHWNWDAFWWKWLRCSWLPINEDFHNRTVSTIFRLLGVIYLLITAYSHLLWDQSQLWLHSVLKCSATAVFCLHVFQCKISWMILGTEPSGSKEKDSWLGIAVVSPESRFDNPVVADGFNNRKPVVSIQVVSIQQWNWPKFSITLSKVCNWKSKTFWANNCSLLFKPNAWNYITTPRN